MIRTTAFILLLTTIFAWQSQGAQPPATPLADLIPTRLAVLPADARPGEAAQITATVANQGAGDARGFWVLLKINNLPQHSQFIGELRSQAETRIEAPWVVTAGMQNLRVEVDIPSRVAESNEENNVLSLQLVYGADLTFTKLTLVPEHPKPGEETRVLATLRNQGTQDINDRFAVRMGVGPRSIATLFLSGLKSGEEQTVEARWIAAEGAQVIWLFADRFGTVSESEEGNNTLTQLFDVSFTEPTGADLVVRDLRLEPPAPQPSQVATLRATVVNQGSGTASGFQVSFQVDGQSVITQSVAGLAAGGTIQLEASWVAEEGERLIRVQADATGRVPELDEANNVSVLAVELGSPLNRCGQYAYLEIRADALPLLVELTGLSIEELEDSFLPQLKRVMEEQYRGVNVRFTFSRPSRGHATILFGPENEGTVLGLAPLGFRFGTARVFLGSFVPASGPRISRNSAHIILATVASHELGHLFGLNHTGQNTNDIMSANADTQPANPTVIPQFAPSSLQQLQRLLPLVCS